MSAPLHASGPDGRRKPEASTVPLRDAALFLDVDGNLLEIAAHPDAVIVEPSLIDLLRRLSLRCSGAMPAACTAGMRCQPGRCSHACAARWAAGSVHAAARIHLDKWNDTPATALPNSQLRREASKETW
jgi:hypothetical protein